MNRFILCLFVLMMSSLVRGQTAPAPAPVTEKKVSSTGFALANNFFGLNLLNKLSEQNEQGEASNVFFSPYSISLALAMLYQGTGGSTSQQLESSLGYELAKLNASDKNALTQQIRDSDNAILVPKTAEKQNYILNSANALVSNKRFPILAEYTTSLQNNFRAELFPVDFASDATHATNLINQFVANKTEGKIEKILLQPLPASTVLALVNAVYFKGNWKNVFDPERTRPDTFTGLKGVKYENVSYMNIGERFKVARLPEINATLIDLPYEGEDLSMYAILPYDAQSDLKLVRSKLTSTFIDTSIGQARAERVRLQFPKFDFKTDYDLIDPLKALGITEVFDGSKADFRGISSGGKLVVDLVKHMATIEVNEKGSVAAAATVIGVSKTSAIKVTYLEFTHPFLFFIRQNRNGQILFIGEVNKF